MLAEVLVWTGLVVIEKVALVDPSETVTLAGSVTIEGLPLASPTVAPWGGAGEFMVTVPCNDDPLTMLAEFTVTEDRPKAALLYITESKVA